MEISWTTAWSRVFLALIFANFKPNRETQNCGKGPLLSQSSALHDRRSSAGGICAFAAFVSRRCGRKDWIRRRIHVISAHVTELTGVLARGWQSGNAAQSYSRLLLLWSSCCTSWITNLSRLGMKIQAWRVKIMQKLSAAFICERKQSVIVFLLLEGDVHQVFVFGYINDDASFPNC